MTAERVALADRIRAALPRDRAVREVSMFGGLSFMADDSLVAAARRNGDLLVRIDPARSDELLTLPGASPAVMGADRSMGPGWITVSQESLTTDRQLAFWMQVALDHLDNSPLSAGREPPPAGLDDRDPERRSN